MSPTPRVQKDLKICVILAFNNALVNPSDDETAKFSLVAAKREVIYKKLSALYFLAGFQ